MAKSDDKGRFQWTHFITYVGSFAIVVLLAGLLVAMVLGLRPLEGRAAVLVSTAHPKVHLAWPMNAVTPDGRPSTWLPRESQAQVEQLVLDALGDARLEVFSSEPLERVSAALGNSGWFDGKVRVTRGSGGAVHVAGDWRLPGAFVRYKGEDYLVSWEGRRLPPVTKVGLHRNFRVIMNPAVAPPAYADGSANYSVAWAGEDIVASMELLRVLSEKAWFGQVAGIDASEYSATGKLVIVTPEQTRVVWGGRPSKPLIGEVSTAQKLAHIAQIMQDYKRIDAGYPLIYVNSVNLQFDISASAKQP
jgi:hypothetical protein